MSKMNRMKIDLGWEDVRLIVHGENSLIGFDEKQICFYRISLLKEFSSINDLHFDQLSFERDFSERIFRLFINESEEILTIITNENLYFLLLPKISSKKKSLCPLVKFHNENFKENPLVNFHWLTRKDFLLFSLWKSSSSMYKCDRYSIEFVDNEWKSIHHDRYSIERTKEENLFKENLLFDQRFHLIQIDSTRIRINEKDFLFIFLQKLNGDIYLLQLSFQSTLNIEKNRNERFIGPIRLNPFRSDNYGSSTVSNRIYCSTIKLIDERIFIFIENSKEIYSMILLNESNQSKDYSLFTIHRFILPSSFSTSSIDQRRIRSIYFDRILSTKFYLIDSLSNIYSIEYQSIDQFLREGNSLQTKIEQIYSFDEFPIPIKYFSTLENHFHGFLFFIINQTNSNSSNRKNLFFFRRRSIRNENVCSSMKIDQISRHCSTLNPSKGIFRQRIEMILQSKQNENLLEEKLNKEKKIREEFENKRKFLLDYNQTQELFNENLIKHFHLIEEKFHLIIDQFDQEIRRHEILRQLTKQISIEKKIDLSLNEEFLRQIEIQINYLKEKIEQIEKIFQINRTNQRSKKLNEISKMKIDEFINYYREEIISLKNKFKDFQTNEIS